MASYRERHIGFALIEESYVNTSTSTYGELGGAVQNPYVRVGSSELRFTDVWFGQDATMIDWSVPESGAWIHDNRRKPFMVDYGVRVHWTDLGEPEFFSELARYAGHDLDGDGSLRTGQADVANVYNLFWHRSIDDGYSRTDPDQRRLLLTRAATAGIQRYGAAVWSGDTSSRMPVLVSQLHNQAHMSCSGIDYYGSDVGGFHRKDTDPESWTSSTPSGSPTAPGSTSRCGRTSTTSTSTTSARTTSRTARAATAWRPTRWATGRATWRTCGPATSSSRTTTRWPTRRRSTEPR